MDKKTHSNALIILSVIAAVLAALDYVINFPAFGLGADSWIGIATVLGVYAVYRKTG